MVCGFRLKTEGRLDGDEDKLFLSIIATGVLLAISGYVLFGQISKVGRPFDAVQKQATPTIIALGNVKSNFNQVIAVILAYTLHNSQEH